MDYGKHFVLGSQSAALAHIGTILSAGARPHSQANSMACAHQLWMDWHLIGHLRNTVLQSLEEPEEDESHQPAQRALAANLRTQRTARGTERSDLRAKPQISGTKCQALSGDPRRAKENLRPFLTETENRKNAIALHCPREENSRRRHACEREFPVKAQRRT